MTHGPWRSPVTRFLILGAALLPAVPRATPADGPAGLTEAEFRKLHEQLQPSPGELWRTVPWRMSILEARDLAAREKKPLVMRVRAGHPLGCV